MPSIDERIVSISFDNKKFEANVAQTMATLGKLNTTIGNVGKTSGISNIEKDASKVTLSAPMRALDNLKGKLGFGGRPAQAFAELETASSKVTLHGANTALDKLNGRLSFPTAPQAFADLEKSSSGVTFEPVLKALDSINSRVGFVTQAAATAMGGLVTKATTSAAGVGKGLTLGPVTQGLDEYSTNLNSIQTILANTQFQGSTLDDVNGALDQLNTYSDQTIYNFGEMARNIGTFTAAGVDLDTSVSSIKGIANLAALSGSNSQQASTAMYQLSQAIASGKVGLQDWNSVVNAGMGGATFQRALTQTAEKMGTIPKEALKIDKATGKATINGESFRESIMAKPGEKSWLTSEVLTTTLGQLTGDMTDAQLAAQGFDEAQIKSIQQTAQTAKKAATEVKTLKGVMDVTKEAIGSGWSRTFQLIFGDFGEAKKTFTDLANTIGKFVGANADARNKVLKEWKKLGGRTVLLDGIKKAFEGIQTILKPIKEAFRDIFPSKTGKDLFEMTKTFRNLMDRIRIGPETAENLKRTFKGLFAVLDIGWQIIKGVAGVFGDLFGALGKGSGGFLDFTGGIGDFLVSLDEALKKGDGLKSFFEGITAIIKVPLELIKAIARAIGNLFGDVDPEQGEGVADAMGKVGDKFKPLAGVLDTVTEAWDNFKRGWGDIIDFFKPVVEKLGNVVGSIVQVLTDSFKNADFDAVFAAVETTLIGGIFLAIKKGIGGGVNVDFGGGLLSNLSDTFKALTGNLQAMQQNIKSKTLLNIAFAIGVLAAAIFVLSLIPPDKIEKAMTAIGIGLGQLVIAMALLTKVGGAGAFIQLPLIAAGMVLLATSLVILAGAVKIFSTMKWEDIGKGLAAIAGVLVAVGVGSKLIGPQILVIAPGLLILGVALTIIAGAMKIFATMKWEEMAKGLIGIAGGLAAIGLGMVLIGPSVLLIGPGILILATGLTVLAGAVALFGKMDFVKMYQGILGIASALVAIGLAMAFIPPTVALQAAGVLILSIALASLSASIAILGSMDIGTLVKGIAAIGAVLLVLAVGLTAMSGTLLGSVALLAAAGAFAILAPALALMGNLKWSTIGKGLAAMALTLAVLAAVGAIAAVPLAALGGALAILGVGLLVVASAVYLASKGISLLGETGPKAVAAIVASITAFLIVMPKLVIDFIKGLVTILGEVAKLVPPIMIALGVIIDAVVAKIIETIPKLKTLFTELLTALMDLINENAGPIINTMVTLAFKLLTAFRNAITPFVRVGIDILVKLIEGIGNGANRLVDAGEKTIEKFLDAIGDKLPKLVDKGFETVIKFLHGIENAIRENDTQLIDAGAGIMDAIIDGVVEAAGRLAGPLKKAIEHLFGMLPEWAKKPLGIHSPSTVFAEIGGFMIEGLVSGLDPKQPERAMATTAKSVVDTAKKEFGRMPDLGVEMKDPTITPVLDLTNVERDAKKLDDLTNVVPITAASSYDQAATIAAQQQAAQAAQAAEATQAAQPVLQFEQNNYSPEKLSDVEIYRQTNNQLSLAKSTIALENARRSAGVA